MNNRESLVTALPVLIQQKELCMFEPIPDPKIDLDLDIPIQVIDLLEHPLVENIYPAGVSWVNTDIVHVHLGGGVIQVSGKLFTNITSVTPIPRYQPDFVLGAKGISYFRGVIEHSWEGRKRYRRFHQKYIDANVDAALVEFIHARILNHLDTPLDEAKRECLWLLIASAALQRQYPNELWFVPWLANAEVKQAAMHIFGAFDWSEITSRGFDLWLAEKNLGEHHSPHKSLIPAATEAVLSDTPFAL